MGYFDDIEASAWGMPEVEATTPYAEVERGYFGDLVHSLWAGSGETLELAGGGLQAFTGGEWGTGLRKVGEYIGETELAKEDISTYLGEDSRFRRVTTGAARAIPGMAAVAGAGVLGAVTAGPVGAIAGATGTMGTIFGGGTYQMAMEDGARQGLEGEELKEYSLELAAWELGSEFIGEGVGYLTFGTLKAPTKMALKNLMKTGKVSAREVIEEVTKKEGGRTVALKLLGAPAIEGGSELLNEIGQNYAGTSRGLEERKADLIDVFLTGVAAGAPLAVIGTAYSSNQQEQIARNLKDGLVSEDPKQSAYTANQVYENLLNVDPQVAEDFLKYYQDGGRDMDVPLSTISQEARAAEVKAEEIQSRKVFLEEQYEGYAPEVPEKILDGLTPSEVLTQELESIKAPEMDVEARVTAGIAERQRLREAAPGVVPEALVGEPTRAEEIADIARVTEAYAPEVPGVRPVAAVMPRPGEITQVPQTPEARYREYFLATPEIKRLYGRTREIEATREASKEVVDNLPKAEEADVTEVLMTSTPENKQAIVEATQAVTVAKDTVASTPVLAERHEAIKEVKKAQKILSDTVEFSRENAIGSIMEPVLAEEMVEVVPEALDRLLTPQELTLASTAITEGIDSDVATQSAKGFVGTPQEFVTSLMEPEVVERPLDIVDNILDTEGKPKENIFRTYRNGTEIFKESKNKYIVRLAGEQGVVYKTLKAATRAAKAGVVEGRAPDIVGKKTISEIRAEERRKKDIDPGDMAQVEEWLLEEGYMETKITEDGERITRVKDEVAIPLMVLLQNNIKLTKGNLNRAIERELKQDIKLTEYERSKGMISPTGEVLPTRVEPLDVVEEVTPEDEPVEVEAKQVTAEELAEAPEKPKVLRFEKGPKGTYVSEWADSSYVLKTRKEDDKFVIDLLDAGEVIGTFDTIQEAAESVGAIIKGEERIAEVVPTVEEVPVEKPKKRKPTVIRRKKLAEIPTEVVEKVVDTEDQREYGEVANAFQGLQLAKRKGNKAVKALAKMVLRVADQESLVNIPVEHNWILGASSYDPLAKTIGLNAFAKENLSYGTIIHETVHALTHDKINTNTILRNRLVDMMSLSKDNLPQVSRDILDTYQSADGILEWREVLVKEHGEEAVHLAYAHSDINEFLGMAMNSQVTQDHMRGILLDKPKGRLKTVWDNFIRGIQDALGLSPLSYTMLDEVLSNTADIIGNDMEVMYHGHKADYDVPSVAKSELGVHMTPARGLAEGFQGEEGLLKRYNISSDKVLTLKDEGSWDDTIIPQLVNNEVIPEDKAQELRDTIGTLGYTDEDIIKVNELVRDAIKDKGYDVVKYTNRFEYSKEQTLANRVREVETEEVKNMGKLIREATDWELKDKYGAKDSYIILDPEAIEGAPMLASITDFARLDVAKGYASITGNRATRFIESSLQGAADLLNSISPKAARYLRDFEFDVNTKTKERTEVAEAWIKDVKARVKDMDEYKDLLLNLNSKTKREAFDKLNKELGIDYSKVEELLEQLRNEGISRGMLGKVKEKELYFPKKVSDLDGLMEHLGDGAIAKEISKLLKERGLEYTPENLSRVYAESLAQGSYPAMLGKPSASKMRTIHKVDAEMAEFYMNPFDTLRIHISEMTESIEQRKLLGKSNISSLEKKLKSEKRPGEIERLQKEIEQAKEITEDNIATWLADEVLLKGLDKAKQRQVKDIFMSRFNPRGLSRGLGFIKNITVANALANFGSTVTQLADLPVSIHKFGFVNVMKALRSQKLYSQEDIDFSGHLKELEDASGWSSRLVEKTLRATGFQQLDAFFKGVGLQASLEKAKAMSRQEFIETYEATYDHPGEAGMLHDKIKRGEKDADVGRFAFNELSQIQPLSTSEMPMAFLKGGNARILYALKSYTLKQLNYISKDIKQTYEREGSLAAAKTASKYIIMMTLANMGTDCIKEFLNGKQCTDLEEGAIDNMLQMVSMSTYTVSEMKKDPVTALLDSLFMPPTDLIKLPVQDMMAYWEGEGTIKTLKVVPGLGRQAWYHLSEEGKAKQEESYEE